MSDRAPANLFDPSLPEFQTNPYPFYRRLRTEAPVYWNVSNQAWVMTRYADVGAVLRDRRFLTQKTFFPEGQFTAMQQIMQRWMLLSDPPAHTRLRGLVNKAFTPHMVDGLRRDIEGIVARLLDQVEAAGTMELIRDLAFPLPVTVIAHMLGVPAADHDRFKRWSQAVAFLGEPIELATPEIVERANQAMMEFVDYFRALVAEKRRVPEDDLLSALIAAEEHGDRLTLDELLANAILLLFAGHETTVNLLGNGVLSLLRHPDQLALLRENPDLIRNAVEECLRYESPVQTTTRLVPEDVLYEGQALLKGHMVLLVLGAANRDPEQFPDPDRLDITRADNRHLAFGAGGHYCVGAPLSRLEAQIAIPMLLRRLPRLQLGPEPPQWRQSIAWRGLRTLPLATR